MRMIDPIIGEFQHEAALTRKCFENIPADKWDWTPHERSMNMGQLASHIREVPSWTHAITDEDKFVLTDDYQPQIASSKEELLKQWEATVAETLEKLQTLGDDRAMDTWTMEAGGQTVIEMPRIAVIRGMILNHLIHHRGQLAVYLRLAGGKVPSIYGPSADDDGQGG
ncbi:MAG TPA: DinB family protein [Acidobacteriota bacterium]|nr:DinB family protein [Acidobacteriota bacterium]